MAIEYVHTSADGTITVKWVDTGLTNEIHLQNTIASLLVQDLLNACRAAEASAKGITFDQIAAASGKEVLGSGVAVGITLQLLGDWLVYSTKTSGVFTVLGGNLVKPDGSSPFRPNNQITYVNVLSASSTIVTTGGGTFTETDRTNLQNTLKPTVPGRTVDVTATGAVGIDLNNVENQSSTLALTGTTIKEVTTAAALTVNNDKTGYGLNSPAIQAIFDFVTEGSWSFLEQIRLWSSILIGKNSGMNTPTGTFRDIDDTKDRVIVTQDGVGNRDAISKDAT